MRGFGSHPGGRQTSQAKNTIRSSRKSGHPSRQRSAIPTSQAGCAGSHRQNRSRGRSQATPPTSPRYRPAGRTSRRSTSRRRLAQRSRSPERDQNHRRQAEDNSELDERRKPAHAGRIDADRNRIGNVQFVEANNAGEHKADHGIEHRLTRSIASMISVKRGMSERAIAKTRGRLLLRRLPAGSCAGCRAS
jgi:hypothetical protein